MRFHSTVHLKRLKIDVVRGLSKICLGIWAKLRRMKKKNGFHLYAIVYCIEINSDAHRSNGFYGNYANGIYNVCLNMRYFSITLFHSVDFHSFFVCSLHREYAR